MTKNKKSYSSHIIIIIIINFLNITLINSQWDMQAEDLSILLSQRHIYIYSYSIGILLSIVGIVIKFILSNFLSQCIKKNLTAFKFVLKIIQSFSVSILVGSIYYHTLKDSFFSQFTEPLTSYYIFILSITIFYILRQSIHYFSNKNNSIKIETCRQLKNQNCKNVHYHIKSVRLPTSITQDQNEDTKQFLKNKIAKNQFQIQSYTDKIQNSPGNTYVSQMEEMNVKSYSKSNSIKVSQKPKYLDGQVILKSLEYILKGLIIGTVFSSGHQKHYYHNFVTIFLYEVSQQLRYYYDLQKKQQFSNKQSNSSSILQTKYLNFFIFFGVILSTHPYSITKLIFQYVLNIIAAFYIVILGQFQINCFKIQKCKDFLIIIPQIFCIYLGTLTMFNIQDAQPIEQDHWHIYSPSYYK